MLFGTIGFLTTLFYSNINVVERKSDNALEFNKFNTAFLQDTKQEGVKVRTIDETNSYLEFENGTRYTWKENGIYRDKVKLCENVNAVSYQIKREYSKTWIEVTISFGESGEYTRTSSYILSPMSV